MLNRADNRSCVDFSEAELRLKSAVRFPPMVNKTSATTTDSPLVMHRSASSAQRVRELVSHTLRDLGADSIDEIDETLLIRDGHYCGRKFECGEHLAIWFTEENEVKFYTEAGTVLKAVATQVDGAFSLRQVA